MEKRKLVESSIGLLLDYYDDPKIISILEQKLEEIRFKNKVFEEGIEKSFSLDLASDREIFGKKLYHYNSDEYFNPMHSNSTRRLHWHYWKHFNNQAWNITKLRTGIDLGNIDWRFYNNKRVTDSNSKSLSSMSLEVFSYLASKSMYLTDEEALKLPIGKWTTHEEVHFETRVSVKTVASSFRSFRRDSSGGFTILKRHVEKKFYEYCIIPDTLGRKRVNL